MAKKQSTPETTNTDDKKEDLKLNKKDITEFISIVKVTNNLPEDFDIESLSPTNLSEFYDSVRRWIASGKPRPQMPKTKEEVVAIDRITRILSHGKEFITWLTQDGQRHGFKLVDRKLGNNVIVQEKKYTIEYSPSKVADLLEKAATYSELPPTMYIRMGEHAHMIRDPKNFIEMKFMDMYKNGIKGVVD